MPATNPNFVTGVTSAAALAAGRFVTVLGAYSGAGGYALGATLTSAAAAGERVPVVVNDTAEVEAGETIAAGDALMSDAAGKAMKLTGTNVKVGRALSAATVGNYVEVLLIPN
jgi:Uncharacterized conserved protein (DUF2190)